MSNSKRRNLTKQKLNSIPTISGEEMVEKGLIDKSVFYMSYSEYKEYQKQFRTDWWERMRDSK